MTEPAIQDGYPDDYNVCFGCGQHNDLGHRLRSFWNGEEAVAQFTPRPEHKAVEGFVYGGVIASLIDCHGIATAAAAASAQSGPTRFVTASLHVDYLRPTPLGCELELRGRPTEVKERKVISTVILRAGGVECARGVVIAVRIPGSMQSRNSASNVT